MFTPGSTPFGTFDNDADFQADADRVVDYVRRKMGDPVMLVHLSSSQIYASFEESTLEYSAMVNSYQAKSMLTQFLGAPTGSLSGSEQTLPTRLMEFQKKLAEPYGEEVGMNGPHPVFSASIGLLTGIQKYDLQALLAGQPPLTGSNQNARIRVTRLYYYSPLQAYRFFGTTSAINYLANQFSFESFTPETIFYLLPIWEDVLRGSSFKLSNKVRRSNYSYELHNNVLTLYPTPTQDINLWLDFMLPPNPATSVNEGGDSFFGVSNLSNIPFGNITYSKVNSIGKQWIRRFAFALAQETEGQIRAKMSSIPIPNGELTLNGPQLIADARADQDNLRNELKAMLDDLTYDKLIEREAQMADATRRAIQEAPLSVYVG